MAREARADVDGLEAGHGACPSDHNRWSVDIPCGPRQDSAMDEFFFSFVSPPDV